MHEIFMNKEKNLSSSQELNLGVDLPNTDTLTTKPPCLLGIGAENLTTSVVILIVHESILTRTRKPIYMYTKRSRVYLHLGSLC